MTDSAHAAMPGYEVRLQTVTVAGGDDLEIRSLLDRQQYYDPDGEASSAGISSAGWSLFGQVWPAAKLLANLMQSWQFQGRRILETGCGLGLASLVIHRRNCCDITASDRHPLAETFLRDNQRRNGLRFMKYATGDWTGSNPALGRFDLIIGSDILYERSHPEQLAGFMNRHALAAAEIVVVDPQRGNRNGFTHAMASHGFSMTSSRIEASHRDGSVDKATLLRYRR